MLVRISCLLILLSSIAYAQIEEVYYESGELKSKTPLNEKGILEGTSFTYYKSGAVEKKRTFIDGQQSGLEQEFYPNGKLKAECNYAYGRVHGLRIEYYQSGDMKLKENWYYGHRKGIVMVYYPGQKLRMYGIVDGDELGFAQRFDESGRLLTERMGTQHVEVDIDRLATPKYYLKSGKSLQQGVNLAQVFIPKVPGRYLSFSSPNGRISYSSDAKYPLILRPDSGTKEFILHISLRPEKKKEKSIQKSIRIPIED
ncbi:MAG: toxin-antitoxin system YwqK family antitoxin [Bacteroidota bacterium]